MCFAVEVVQSSAVAEKCQFCEKRAYDNCVVCDTPVCEMHGVIIGEKEDIVCMPCKRKLLEKEEGGNKTSW
jgi:hypothetical protein